MARLSALAAGLVPLVVSLMVSLVDQRAARADGAFPDSLAILTPAELPHEILMATNFGLVASVDDGQTWVWSCEQELNNFGILYQLGPPPLDRLYAISQGRLVFSDDASCSWTQAAGAPAGTSVVDAFPDPTKMNRVLSIANTADGDGGILYSLLESTDAGATVGTTLYRAAAGDVITGIEIARSQPTTLYITLLSGPLYIPKLGRSDDGGMSWQLYDLSTVLGQRTTNVLLISVDPTDPQRVLLRVRGTSGEHVAITTDGGAHLAVPLDLTGGVVTSFARMQSGTIVVGGAINLDPVAFRSTDRGQTFVALPAPPHLRGLSARGGALYGVTDNSLDGYAVGISNDEGMTWSGLVSFDHIQAIAACVKTMCQDDCHMRADMDQWPDTMCDATPMPQPIIAAADGGARDAAPDAPADAGHDAAPTGGAPTPPGANKGCACAAAPSDGGIAASLAFALTLVLARRRRPGSRAPTSPSARRSGCCETGWSDRICP